MPEGRELLKRLVALSDVVVENFSPRVMVQYELDYQHLHAVRPDLIMVSMPGFGQSGPHSAFVSYGGPLMAYTGMALLWGHADSPLDAHSKIAYPDYTAAGTCALAVTAALHHRASTGQGQYIEIAQVETTTAAMEVAFFDYFTTGTIAAPSGNRDPNSVPQGCYPASGHDAWCVMSCPRMRTGMPSPDSLVRQPWRTTRALRQRLSAGSSTTRWTPSSLPGPASVPHTRPCVSCRTPACQPVPCRPARICGAMCIYGRGTIL